MPTTSRTHGRTPTGESPPGSANDGGSGRRWNLRLKNGVDVRLPEADVAKALDQLTALDRDKKLLSKDVTMVDLRFDDRVTVRLSDAAATAREEALKAKKPKKEGGA